MAPKDGLETAVPKVVTDFLTQLPRAGFQGDINIDKATRLINATDNSIYQILPQAVLAPKTADDIDIILKLGAMDSFQDISFVPRGGGTGTNGQALNDCIIIDTSKYLTEIIEVNPKEEWVRVQPGVVLDQLNNALKPHELFFPPHISPSKSATLGGMVSTDACGKGSRIYGKTSHYILSMTCVLANGTEIKTNQSHFPDIEKILKDNQQAIHEHLPKLPRGTSGLDLSNALKNQKLDLNHLIAGSEGSLAIIKEIKLRIIPKPKYKSVFIIAYDNFDTALRDINSLLAYDPFAIETIDDKILDLTKTDILWHDIQEILPKNIETKAVKALHFVEFEASSSEELNKKVNQFHSGQSLGYEYSDNPNDITQIAALRSKAVGLLGNMSGNRRPIGFIEDTAVPPENLADYIADFRKLLDEYNLTYGIFGHSDAGCLHVRPALNLKDPDDEKLIRILTDHVVSIVKKHDGILWGEHGKGMRGEYTNQLISPAYYQIMQQIKKVFDPHDKLNPGKVVTSGRRDLMKIDQPPLRAHYDRQIDHDHTDPFSKSLQCNGNGMCFSTIADEQMCPSYKITRDRRQSPKGRAALLREWLRKKDNKTFSTEVYQALNGCLSCKACTNICPIHVNIPDMKAVFLEQYYKSHLRPIKDYCIANAEIFAFLQSYLPLSTPNLFGLIDMPKPAWPPLRYRMKQEGFSYYSDDIKIKKEKTVFFIQDAFTSFYESHVVISTLKLIRFLGFTPIVVPFRQSGKSWHVRGFIKKFEKIAQKNASYYDKLAMYKVPMIGLDPSVALTYRDEYKKYNPKFKIQLLQEWLLDHLDDFQAPHHNFNNSYKLFIHCTENTALPKATKDWQKILSKFQIDTDIIQTGCCGMAGAYGHEKEHYHNSKGLYALSWKDKIASESLVTGYSCRTQIKRFDNKNVIHPVELLEKIF